MSVDISLEQAARVEKLVNGCNSKGVGVLFF